MSEGTAVDSAPTGNAGAAGQGEECPTCRRRLPLRPKRPGEAAMYWECVNCRSPLSGVLLQAAAFQSPDALRICQTHFDTRGVLTIPSMLRQLIREFIESRRNAAPADDRRVHPRVPRELDAVLLPLDEQWLPRGNPFVGVVIDLTPQGLGMVTMAAGASTYVAMQIQFPAAQVQIVGKVVWTQPIGQDCFNSGIQFLVRLGRGAQCRDAGSLLAK